MKNSKRDCIPPFPELLKQIRAALGSSLPAVDQLMADTTAQGADDTMRHTISVALSSGGKRLRPLLVLSTARALDYDGEKALRAAAALELVHTASLVHDDIIDNEFLRRGAPSIYARRGPEIAVLLGDLLFARSLQLLSEEMPFESVSIVADATSRLSLGDIRQQQLRSRTDISESDYLSVIENKTASLMAACCRMGALVSGADARIQMQLSRYGQAFGMVYQLIDDMHDIVADRAVLGKDPGSDIREGKITLPLIRLLEVARESDRDRVLEQIGSPEADIALVRTLLRKYEVYSYCLDSIAAEARTCDTMMRSIPESPFKQHLRQLPFALYGRLESALNALEQQYKAAP